MLKFCLWRLSAAQMSLDRAADPNEGFEHRHLPWFTNANGIPALNRENVVVLTTGGGDGGGYATMFEPLLGH